MTRGLVIWLTGLPRAGKSTLARAVQSRLAARSVCTVLLDGDDVRGALVPSPGYDSESRNHFYATLGRLAALIAQQGFTVLVPATAHRRVYRDDARVIAPAFLEVYVAAPLGDCMSRDPAGLYASKAHDALPGAGVDYEPPRAAEVTATGGDDGQALDTILAFFHNDQEHTS